MSYFPAQEEVTGLDGVMSESAFLGLGSQNSQKQERSWLGATAPAGEAWQGQAVLSQLSLVRPGQPGQVRTAVLIGGKPRFSGLFWRLWL